MGPRCYNCGEFGHITNKCTKPKQEKGTCFECRKKDHMIKDSPIRKKKLALRNQDRSTHLATQIHLQFPKYDHEEYLEALVLELGHNQMLLRIDWLNFHNPEVDWSMPSLQFMRCPKHCSKNASQLTIRWAAKAEKQPMAPPKPEIDENGLSKGLKPNYIKPFQHLSEKKNFDKLPIRRKWDHEINLTENAPASIPARCYRMTPVEQEAINQFVEDELKAGKICECKSPYASPCFFITKKDGSRRLIQDYQKINAFTVKDKTPLPRINDLLDVLEDGVHQNGYYLGIQQHTNQRRS